MGEIMARSSSVAEEPLQPLRQIVIGFDPRGGDAPFTEGRIGDFAGDGFFDRMFLFGEPEIPSTVADPRYITQAGDFGEGQQRPDAHGMPSFRLQLNGGRSSRFSREVVAACSQGVDPKRVVAFAEALSRISNSEVADMAIMMFEVLKSPPALGWPISPKFFFTRHDQLCIRDLPIGMRLYLTGQIKGIGR